MKPIRTLLAALGALFGLTVLAACQTPSIGAGASEAAPTVVREVTEYELGAGDQLRVTVFNETDLSGEFVVNGGGYVSMPLIGEVQATGSTVREFQRRVEQRLYTEGILRQPRVSAEVLNFRPYYILGEVKQPGEYPYSEGLTVMNAIATAQGFTYRANEKVVMIKGAKDTKEVRVELTPNTILLPGDTIRVLERFF